MKQTSAFWPAKKLERLRHNLAADTAAGAVGRQLVEAAQPWLKMSDEQLWSLMFGPNITRSWMVWSNGHCPACHKSVPMYQWVMDAVNHPWKVRCPHCNESFPKNDFAQFHASGLDEHGVFQPERADRKLLFNAEHPDASDPLRSFGVDDGEGYVDGEKRWRFIGAYLVYGQWKQRVVNGIRKLAEAYAVSGDPACARKAAILLDRVADLYPSFDHVQQAVVYETVKTDGYVSTWHDACEETRYMTLAYDMVFDALRDDRELVEFLSAMARRHRLENPKASFADIQRNIEDRILRDAVANPHKVHSNRPRCETLLTQIETVLGWPGNREKVMQAVEEIVRSATAVDGITGEKGLTAYSALVVHTLAEFLSEYDRLDERLLAEVAQHQPTLKQTWRFHVDTWCLGRYYPSCGDASSFCGRNEQYAGLSFSRPVSSPAPSMFTFLWRLYELTGDPAYVQVLYRANDSRTDGLPHDLLATDAPQLREKVRAVIAKHGAEPQLASVNKSQWHLGILRGGKGQDACAAWLDYDSAGGHAHHDGMNLGLFAKGLDLLPDFGYPPVQFGGWDSPRATWYAMTAAHNTVTVDGQNQSGARWTVNDTNPGKVTLWGDGNRVRAVRASGANMYAPQKAQANSGCRQYERTALLVQIDDRDFYLLDIFRVVGASDHAKFTTSHFGTVTTKGLALKPADDYGFNTQMRNFRSDPSPGVGWQADWKIDDRYKLLPAGADVHFRYTSLTTGAEAAVCEAWIVPGTYDCDSPDGEWVPRIMERRRSSQTPLASTFVAVMDVYENRPALAGVRRLPLHADDGGLYGDADVAVEAALPDGGKDLIVAMDIENPLGRKPSLAENKLVIQKDWSLRTDASLCLVRLDKHGKVQRVALSAGRMLQLGPLTITLPAPAEFVELRAQDGFAPPKGKG